MCLIHLSALVHNCYLRHPTSFFFFWHSTSLLLQEKYSLSSSGQFQGCKLIIRKLNLITEIPHSAIWTSFFLIPSSKRRKIGWSCLLFKGPCLPFIITLLPHLKKNWKKKLIKVIIIILLGSVRILIDSDQI